VFQIPNEPSADMRQLAGISWDAYTAFKQQGFERAEALELVKTLLRAGFDGANGG
jgi:hypothetical protein